MQVPAYSTANRARAAVDPDLPDLQRHTPPFITQAISIIRRRKWVIVAAVVGALLIGLVVTFLMTPQYSASATIEIQREQGSIVNLQGSEQKTPVFDQEFYQTQYGLLKSQSLAERVATTLKLPDDPKFFALFGVRNAEEWFRNGIATREAPPRDTRTRIAGQILNKHMKIDPERLSRLVVIRFTSPDPQLSKRVVDAWGQSFVQITLERRYEASSYARRFIEQKLEQLRTRIDQSERQSVDYAARQGIVNVPGNTTTGGETSERSLIADDLASLNRDLAQATTLRINAESRLAARGGAVSEALTNPAIGALRQRRGELAAEYAKLLVQFEPGYPPARALKTQIDQIDRTLSGEEGRVRDLLQQNYQSALNAEQQLQTRVDALKGNLLDLRRRSIQYNIIQRDTDTNRQLYDALLQQYKAIGITGGVGVNNISIVDPAEMPQTPSSPVLMVNMALALVIGLLLGSGAAWMLEQIDQGIADPGELEKVLGIPLLGTIPLIADETPMQALEDRKSAIGEAYISLQTSLSFSTDHGVPRVLAITSSRPAEGKSTTSYALARSLARGKRPVLLVDGDMRSPSIHYLLGLSNEAGLSNFLSGSDDVDALVHQTDRDGLHIMTAGPQPPSAAELLSSDRLGLLIAELLKRFDHIVFDAPPVMGLADAPLIGSRVEGVALVVESHATQKSMMQVAVRRLFDANNNVLGAVLTKFNAQRAHFGYGYDYGYGYGYGQARADAKD